jgi:hypothetical protein
MRDVTALGGAQTHCQQVLGVAVEVLPAAEVREES